MWFNFVDELVGAERSTSGSAIRCRVMICPTFAGDEGLLRVGLSTALGRCADADFASLGLLDFTCNFEVLHPSTRTCTADWRLHEEGHQYIHSPASAPGPVTRAKMQ